MPNIVRNALASAMPVTTPGSAIGRMISSETVSRPKNRKRCSARAAIVPSTSAISGRDGRHLEGHDDRRARARGLHARPTTTAW